MSFLKQKSFKNTIQVRGENFKLSILVGIIVLTKKEAIFQYIQYSLSSVMCYALCLLLRRTFYATLKKNIFLALQNLLFQTVRITWFVMSSQNQLLCKRTGYQIDILWGMVELLGATLTNSSRCFRGLENWRAVIKLCYTAPHFSSPLF